MKMPGRMMAELLRNVAKTPATTRYPFVKEEPPKDFRGRIEFISEKCIGCKICMRDCPAYAITINKPGEEKIFEAVIDLDRCIYCAQCVLSCPKDALLATKDYELAQIRRESLKRVYPARPKPPKAEIATPSEGNVAQQPSA